MKAKNSRRIKHIEPGFRMSTQDKKNSCLAINNEHRNYSVNKLFQIGTRKYSTIIQCRANKTNSSVDTFTAYIKTNIKKNKQLYTIEQGLCWNYVNWNWKYDQILVMHIPSPIFYEKSAMQTTRLHDSAAMQRLKKAQSSNEKPIFD